jgi:pyruvate,water dikinase
MSRLTDPDAEVLPSTRVHHGYAYISSNWVRQQAQSLPAAARANALAWFPPLVRAQILAEPFRLRQFWQMLRAPYADPGRGPINRNLAALEQHCGRVDAVIVPKLAQDYTALSAQAWADDLEQVDQFGLDHFRVIRWGMSVYNSALHAILPKLLVRWSDDADGQLYESIIGGLTETMTARINREVSALGSSIRADPHLRAVLLAGADLQHARSQAPDASFWPKFEAFLTAHGHRAATRDISQPRWSETPEVILGMIVAQVRPDMPPDMSRAERDSVARRQSAEAQALRRAGRLRRRALRTIISLTQRYTMYRENQRYHLDYLLAHVRNLLLEQGRRLTERGVLTDRAQVFLLHLDQLRALADGAPAPADLPTQLAQRHDHLVKYRDRLPVVYLFDDVEVDETMVDDERPATSQRDGCIYGVAACRGTSRGTTKVVHDLAGLADIASGDILVANNIDPGWTSVFPVISGLITTTGGVLSHGAILAREYGLPTVTGITDATSILPTGTEVEIDGGAGTVVIL